MRTIKLTDAELDTILASLRSRQCIIETGNMPLGERHAMIEEIATRSETHPAMDADGIERLCQKINS